MCSSTASSAPRPAAASGTTCTGSPGLPATTTLDAVPADGFGDLPTIFDRLEQAGVSWKFYVQNYDPRITFRSASATDRGSQIVWVPLLDYARYLDDPKLFSHIVDINEYYKDLEHGTLPEVAYIVAVGVERASTRQHPGGPALRAHADERADRELVLEELGVHVDV